VGQLGGALVAASSQFSTGSTEMRGFVYRMSVYLQVVSSPELDRSGVYWSWNNTNGSFENDLSEESSNQDKAKKLWELSMKMVGLE